MNDEQDYCWCGTRVTYLSTVGKWLCSAHGYQERVYGPTPGLPTIPYSITVNVNLLINDERDDVDIFTELRTAVLDYDDWPTPEKRAQVIDLARRFVGAVDQQAAAIEHMRQHVTPSEQALSELLNPLINSKNN